jgi:hypothetical protein
MMVFPDGMQGARKWTCWILCAVLLCPAAIEGRAHALSLGNTGLGESFEYFKADFPAAKCQPALYGATTDFYPIGSRIPDEITCCVHNEVLLGEYSIAHIIDDSCGLLVRFRGEKLVALEYWLDVPTIEAIQPFLERQCGPATERMQHSKPPRLILIGWRRGQVNLTATLVRTVSKHIRDEDQGEPGFNAVAVRLSRNNESP